MNKKKLLALLAKKEARKKELGTKAEKAQDVAELRGINEELTTINTEIEELRGIIDSIPEDDGGEGQVITGDGEQRAQTPVGKTQILATYGVGTGQSSDDEKRENDLLAKFEQRGKDLKEKRAVNFSIDEVPELRAVTLGGGSLVTATHTSPELNPRHNEVSSLVDMVNAVPLPGGEAYKKGFEVSAGEGDYTTEEGNYTDADPEYNYVDINKAKITAYAEISDEAMKLPNVDYQSRVARDVGLALRKKLTRQILVGAGGSNAIRGIFNAPTSVIPADTDIQVSSIDADTLDNIIFGYGGDEDVEGGAVLILNKKDLAAFAKVRSTDGKKLYKIKKNGNTGTISSDDSFEVPFVINSAAPALSADGTVADTYCMAYGMVKAYEMPVFSDILVEESRDFKFKTGQVAYRGSVWAGGNVAMHKGFVRVKKVAAEPLT
ncbi:phage major capsid protein [Alkalicella caledoniensis]|uniref:Phage major capsid protein n=1 Tax=Alkalicella caledoniensis TaxID=2731377 RepID=A0A7G9W8B7_ALKCA|nr:phage major capsid protein [Alkalicella caledoniensis]QNO14929.1 phage major capsid protein [Alkalicella caledoniensis]